MSVISSNSKVIFCEGKENSLDYLLLNLLLNDLLDKPTIVPSGGKFSFSTFAQGYFSNNQTQNQRYIVFRDGDFDANPTDEIQLLPLLNNNHTFLTHRACIENYLLDANLIHTYWTEKYTEQQWNRNLKWGHGNSPGIEMISAWIETAAKSLQDYQAVRWALGDLSQSSASRTQLRTTWMGNSGNIPNDLTLAYCKNEALNLINQFTNAVGTVTQEIFTGSLAVYQQKFSEQAFWEEKKYLIWFHGKDIQKEMQKQQPQYISLKHFFKSVFPLPGITSNLNAIQFIASHPDFEKLKEKINQL